MTGEIEVFLDDTPGETRGIVMRGGRFERLIIQREDDPAPHRLGARSIGRVVEAKSAFRAAFVDLGCEGPSGYLPLAKGVTLTDGEAVDVEVTAEPRERKGPTLRLLGLGQGAPRLLFAGPRVADVLKVYAPDLTPVIGTAAIQASWDAEAEALPNGEVFAEFAIDLAVERTRALIAVDIDYAHLPGRDARKGREQANREGLRQAARIIRLKSWGGLVAIDLVGTGLESEAMTRFAKAAFAGDRDVVFGPLSRFGLMQVSIPWGRTPVEEKLTDSAGRLTQSTHAIDVVRRLRMRLLADTAIPRFVARCSPKEAAIVAPLAARFGPRAAVKADATVNPGCALIEEG